VTKDEQRILFLFGLHIISLSKAVFHLQPFVMAATTAATTAFGRKKIRPQKPAGKKQLRRIMLYKQGSSSVYLSD